MTMVTVTKQSASVIPMAMTYPMIVSQNSATPKSKHTVTLVSLNLLSNTRVTHASGKRKDTNMMQKSRT